MTLRREVTTSSAEQTRALGVGLGRLLQPGDFVGLSGELGAGKTQLSRGVAEGAGVDPGEVSSPTYSVVQSYLGRLTLHHADLYRLTGPDDLYSTGYFDLLESGGAMLVEWVEKIALAAPDEALRIELTRVDDTTRRLTALATGARHVALLEAWLDAVD